ncbi:restriction endonuclease subunit S, partial [Acinetobacter baumannii]
FCTLEFFNSNQNYIVDSEYLITTLRDLVPSGPSIGYIVKYESNKKYILAQGVYGFRIKNDLNRDFLIQFSNTSKFRLHMQSIMVGSTQVHIRNQDYFSTELYTPSLLEQTKIASFLSTVDEKISQLTQKHELLSQYKQGMMQKLFSQQIRFKADDGSEFGEWEEVALSKVSDVRDGTHDSPSYVKDGYPLITSKNLKNGKLDLTDINLISEDDYLNINKRSAVNIGDIIFGMIGTIGNPVLLNSDGFAIKNVALIKEKDELLN